MGRRAAVDRRRTHPERWPIVPDSNVGFRGLQRWGGRRLPTNDIILLPKMVKFGSLFTIYSVFFNLSCESGGHKQEAG